MAFRSMGSNEMWIGRSFWLREKLRAISLAGDIEYLVAGTVVAVVSENVMHIVTVEADGRRLLVFARDLEKCGDEINDS